MKWTLHLLFFTWSFATFSQNFLERTAEKTADKVKNRVENRVDRGIDKSLNKAESELEDAVKKDKSKDKSNSDNKKADSTNSSQTNESDVEKKSSKESSNTFAAYSKFDFVSGEKVILYDDFSQDEVGDFPVNWNTNSGGEIVTLSGDTRKWLSFTNKGIYFPENLNDLPENFTIEFDFFASEDFSEMQSGLKLIFPLNANRNVKFEQFFNNQTQVGVDLHPTSSSASTSVWVCDKSNQRILENEGALTAWKPKQINRISIWRQKARLRVYVNEVKIWDIPRAFIDGEVYSMLFATNIFRGTTYISDIKVGVGAPDTRNKLLTEGKVVSRGILFDTNSDKIKPESYGEISSIAKTLQELPEVKVRIVGHTDSDGDEAKNLELSLKRAKAVQAILSKEFNIPIERMIIDGKGESEPSDSNATPTGKAMNRRVEFIKL